jgi:hypothetical protein
MRTSPVPSIPPSPDLPVTSFLLAGNSSRSNLTGRAGARFSTDEPTVELRWAA